MRKEIEISLNDLKSAIQGGIPSETDKSIKMPSTTDVQIGVGIVTEIFKAKLEPIIKEIVNSRVTQPLTTLTISNLQKHLENKVTKSFEQNKNNFQISKIRPQNYNFAQSKNTESEVKIKEKEEAGFLYEDKLDELLLTTNNPISYVQIIMAGIGIDVISCRAIACVIATRMPINLIIKYSKDESYTHLSSDDTNVETKYLNLTSEKLSKDIEASKIFDAIMTQIPAISFKDESEFKQALVEFIKNDHEWQIFLQTKREPSEENKPMTSEEFFGLLNSSSQNPSRFSTISATPRLSNILFSAYNSQN
uniref:Uncharacterized protein n=1 Tax=Panagrolaimus davidi TaxID=227884 RepID=A0A914P2V4_9BILA